MNASEHLQRIKLRNETEGRLNELTRSVNGLKNEMKELKNKIEKDRIFRNKQMKEIVLLLRRLENAYGNGLSNSLGMFENMDTNDFNNASSSDQIFDDI